MHKFANPARFSRIARALLPWLTAFGVSLTFYALFVGLFVAPADEAQSDYARIMFVHVPAAWLGMAGWSGIALASLMQLVWRHPLAGVAARAIAVPGAVFTAICLVTGSIWGKPTWGTWWEWDGRMTSMLVLLFLYIGYVALANADEAKGSVSRLTALYGLVGAINIPIIHYSVVWWHSLHQVQSISLSGSKMSSEFLWPLLVSAIGFSLLFAAIVLMRMLAFLAEAKAEARMRRMAIA